MRFPIVQTGTTIGSAEVDMFGGIGNIEIDPDYLDWIVPGIVLSEQLTIVEVGEGIQPFLFFNKDTGELVMRRKENT